MSIDKRLNALEQAQGSDNGPDNLVIHLSWEDDDPQPYEVDGERMSIAEFRQRWPNYKMGDEFEVRLSWGDDCAL